MKRILLCGPLANAGGVSSHTKNLIDSLSNLEVNVIVYNFLGGREDLAPLKISSFKKIFRRTIGLIIECIKKRNDYEIIHIQTSGGISSFISAIFGVIPSKILRKRLAITFHYSNEKFYKKYAMLLTFVIKNSDIFITVSERNKGILCKYVDNKCISKIVVVPNGYDNNLFKPNSKEKARSELGISEKSVVIVNIANLLPHKGHQDLIKAIELLKTHYKIENIICYIIGQGPLYNNLSEMIKTHSLEENIVLTGWISSDKMVMYLNASNLFAFTSLPNGESFGIAQIEAMGCGVPIVATKNGASEEIVTSDYYGLLCESNNPRDLAEKISVSLNKEWDQEKIIKYTEQYTWKNITKQTFELYSKIRSE